MTLAQLNALDATSATREFLRCCGSTRWADKMTAARPYAIPDAMFVTADVIWAALDRQDWLEAFAAHPRIGAGKAGGAGGAGEAGRWSAQEQSGVAAAAQAVIDRLATKNQDYESRFGYIFIVCATGRSADEMLDMLERRLANDPDRELHIAAEEQRKITRLRLEKLLAEPSR